MGVGGNHSKEPRRGRRETCLHKSLSRGSQPDKSGGKGCSSAPQKAGAAGQAEVDARAAGEWERNKAKGSRAFQLYLALWCDLGLSILPFWVSEFFLPNIRPW